MKKINRKIKNIRVIIFLLLTVIVLSACSSNNNNPNENGNNDGDPSQTYDLIWWNLFESEEVMQPLIDEYESSNPNINIRYVQRTEGAESGDLIGDYRELLDENLTDNESLDTPDIITINNTWLGRYQQYLAASSSLTSAEIQSNYFSVITKDFVRNNNVYAVPLSVDALALISNTELMAQISAADSSGPVDSWFDFLDQAERVTTRNENSINISGFAAGSSNVEFAMETISTIMMQSGIDMASVDSLSGFSDAAVFADNAESEVVLDYYKSYNSDFDIWDESFNSEIAAFLSKKLVSFIGPSWRLNDIFRLNQTYSLGLNPEVFKMPQIDPGNPDSNIYWATYWGQAVTKDSQQRGQSAVAWDFIKFLSQPEQLRKYNELVRQQEGRNLDIIYPRIEMAQEQKSDQYLSPYIESLEQADSWDMIDGFEVSNIFKEALASASLNSDSIQSRINMEIIEQRTTLVSGP